MSPVAPCAAAMLLELPGEKHDQRNLYFPRQRHYVIIIKAHRSLQEGEGLIRANSTTRMDSAHGTKTVRLQRKKSGFDFSVKGGHEHGIPVVVSWIKEGGAAGE